MSMRAALAYSTEWLIDLRILTDPYDEYTDQVRRVVQLCSEAAWHDLQRHGIQPGDCERIVASVRLVFAMKDVDGLGGPGRI